MTARAGLVIALAVACGSSRRSAMYPAGSDKDDGYGELAQKSARLLTHDGADPVQLALRRPHIHAGDPYGGDPYGGAAPDDEPAVAPPAPPAPRRYHAVAGLTGTVEGVVRWRGAPPPPLTTACGAIEHPAPRVAADHTVGGVLITIEPLATGRVLPSFARAASVGGTIVKRGCALAPALQIVTPLPASLTVHGDAGAARLVATLPAGTQAFELPPAGRVTLPAHPGVTRIEAADGSLGAAWIVATDTPYYALTDDDGRFRITELAPGTYDLTFWQPARPTLAGGTLRYGAPVTTHRTLKVDASHVARIELTLAP